MGEQEMETHTEPPAEESKRKEDPGQLRFTQILAELGADRVFRE